MSDTIFIVGEDDLCCSVGEALVRHTGIETTISQRLVAGGADPFKKKISAMNRVAEKIMPVLMIADADQASCVVEQRNAWLPRGAHERLLMRLAVREAEAWILADDVGFARFASINQALFPRQPDEVADPKRTLLGLIARGKNRDLREEMLAPRGSKSLVGLGYNLRLAEFVGEHWHIERAIERSPSLARILPRLTAVLANNERR
ncbi:hypothetical protein LN047_02205 [Achromobacter sp. JD417]|uniref:hypothetical protein n=1 Tax=Achromobacter sp. JD417 TaxID=2893881 RepID=UPI0035A61B0F